VVDSATVSIIGNVVGRNMAGSNIGFFNYGNGRAPYGVGNTVCGNVLENGSPALVYFPVGVTLQPCPKFISLPVKLLSFTATKKGNKSFLEWKTDQEVNFNYYDLERSGDGSNFSKIATIYPNGFNKYQFTDLNTLSGANFYRLKMVDLSGAYTYSTIQKITFYGNEKYTVEIFNYLGQLILRKENVEIDEFKQQLGAGSYIIRYSNKTQSFTEKIIK
jgi:hypothetical protein